MSEERLEWTVPRGETYEAVIADAVRQVIANYGPCLRALARHDARLLHSVTSSPDPSSTSQETET